MKSELWRVGWVDEDGETYYSIALADKKDIGDLCKSVEKFELSPTGDVWIEHTVIEWKKIVGTRLEEENDNASVPST